MIEEVLRAALNVGSVTTLIGQRVYPVRLPQDPQLPAATYRRIGRLHDKAHTGDTGLRRARFQFSVFASEGATPAYDVARNVADAMTEALTGLSTADIQGVFIEDGLDDREPETDRWVVTFDAIVWHRKEAA